MKLKSFILYRLKWGIITFYVWTFIIIMIMHENIIMGDLMTVTITLLSSVLMGLLMLNIQSYIQKRINNKYSKRISEKFNEMVDVAHKELIRKIINKYKDVQINYQSEEFRNKLTDEIYDKLFPEVD